MAITLEEAKKYIEELDLNPVIERVMREKGWTRRMAEVTAQFYKNFLYLSKKYEEYTFNPSTQIDEMWHVHIIFTKDYHEICEKVFGHYFHHTPLEHANDRAAGNLNFQKLLELHEKEFGYPIQGVVYSLKDLCLYVRSSIIPKFKKK